MKKGFTLIEVLISVALLAILVGVGVAMINPAGQLASARNNQRINHLQAIMLAVRENIADQGGQSFSCASGPLPTSSTNMASTPGSYNIAPCLIPIYAITLPTDPSVPGAHYASVTDYDTGYHITYNASTTEITLSAPAAELGKTITLTK